MSTSSKPTSEKGVKTLRNKLPSKSLIPSRRQSLPMLERQHKTTMKTPVAKRRASEHMNSCPPQYKKNIPSSKPPPSGENRNGVQSRKRYTMNTNSKKKTPITTMRRHTTTAKASNLQSKREAALKFGVSDSGCTIGAHENIMSSHLTGIRHEVTKAPKCTTGDSDTDADSDLDDDDIDDVDDDEDDAGYDSDSDSDFVSGAGRAGMIPSSSSSSSSTTNTKPLIITSPHPTSSPSRLSLTTFNEHPEDSKPCIDSRRGSSYIEKLKFPTLECGGIGGRVSPNLSPRKSIAQLEEEITNIEDLFSRVQEAERRGNVRKRILVYSTKE